MSLLWRQRFILPDGEGYYRLMMRNPDTRLAYLCDRCPCDGGWSIVALCACSLCGPADPFFIGDQVEVDSDTVTAEYDGETYNLVLLNIENQATPDTAMSDDGTWGQREAWPVCHGIEGSTRLWGVRHFSREAPEHDGYYNVQVILDGTVAVEWDGTPYVPGESAWVGDQVPTANKNVNAIMVDHLFDEEGDHTVDLKVSFIGDNDEPTVSYTLRVAVFIVKNSAVDPLEPGQAIIVPHKVAQEEGCIVRGEVSGYPVRLYFHDVLKGPFDSLEDAEYVLSTFSGIIGRYAATCVCPQSCTVENATCVRVGYGFGGHPTTPELWVGSGDEQPFPQGCLTEWLVVEYSVSANGDSNDCEIRVTDGGYDGKIFLSFTAQSAGGPYRILIPPCTVLETWVMPSTAGSLELYAEGWTVSRGTCCLDDPASPYYGAPWVYDTDTNEGVPNNSAELADYLESIAI